MGECTDAGVRGSVRGSAGSVKCGVIDTHCHLTFPDLADVSGVLARAAEHGVTGVITISTTTRDCLKALAIAEQFSNVWCSAGVHPLYSDKGPHEWENLRRCIGHHKCVAWGELGLDSHYSEPAKAVQLAVLEEQLAFIESCHAAMAPKPIVLHCREAFAELIPILRRTRLAPEKFVFHCFTGGVDDMRMLLDFGACVSFTGVITYKNAPEVREAARLVPRDRIMVETDAPFLSPVPHRSVRPCEPWMVSITAKALAEARGEAWEEFHAAINENSKRFYGVG